MAKIESWFNCDLKKAVSVQTLNGNVFSLDNNGNRLVVRFYDNGQPTTVTGGVSARFILPDGSTVNAIAGTLTTVNGQSVAYIDVPQSVLLIPGILKITIQLTDSSVVTTVAAIIATVYLTKTDNEITPSQQVIADWNAEITAAIARQDATISGAIAEQNARISSTYTSLDQKFTTLNAEHNEKINRINNRANELSIKKVNKPLDAHGTPVDGVEGQYLRTKGDGSTEWINIGVPTDAQTQQAISDWLDDHPEATTTVEDGSLTYNKFSEALKTILGQLAEAPVNARVNAGKRTIMSLSVPMGEYFSQFSSVYAMGGAVYNPDKDVIVVGFKNVNGTGLLIELNPDWSFNRANAVDGGHFNDLTYNTNTGKYYIPTTRIDGSIAVVDADTLIAGTTVYITIPNQEDSQIDQLSYDEINNCYYLYSHSNLYKASSDFTNVELRVSGIHPSYDLYEGLFGNAVQGSCMYNGRFVSQYELYTLKTRTRTRLVFMNSDNTAIDYYYDYENVTAYDECESLVNIGDHIISASWFDTNLVLCELSTNNFVTVQDENFICAKEALWKNTGTDIFDDIHNQVVNKSYYIRYIRFSNVHPVFGGTAGYLIGMRTGANAGWQMYASPYITMAIRKRSGSSWENWTQIKTNKNDGAITLTPGENVIITANHSERIGNILLINFNFTLSASKAVYGYIAYTGLSPKCSWRGVLYTLGDLIYANNNIYSDWANKGIRVAGNSSLPAGDYRANAIIQL